MKEHIIRHTKRLLIAVVGLAVVLLGIVMIPYPGPGWLVVFAGLAILATEFEFAQKILDTIHVKYDLWQDWLRRQNIYIQSFFWIFTAAVIVMTIWLLNGYGVASSMLGLDTDWLASPIFR